MKTNRLTVSAAMAAALAVPSAWASPTYVIDQANPGSPYYNYNIDYYAPIWQGFVPSADRLDRVELRLTDNATGFDNPLSLQVRIRQGGTAGTVLGTSVVTDMTNAFTGYLAFDFPSTVGLTPGQPYTIELATVSSGFYSYAWTTSNGNTYADGAPTLTGNTPVGDFLFRTGYFDEPATEFAPVASGSVRRADNGALSVSSAGFIDWITPESSPTGIPRQTRAVVEYDMSGAMPADGKRIVSASIAGKVFINNGNPTGDRIIALNLYDGQGTVDAGDYAAPGAELGVVSYDPDVSNGVEFDLDVTTALRSLLNQGADHAGVRFTPLNAQPPSVLSGSDLPLLSIVLGDWVLGDTDGDGDTDDADIGAAFAAYTGPVSAAGNRAVTDGDTDGDGDTDDGDLGAIFAAYTGPLAPPAVPEPASLALLAIGGGLLVVRRRRLPA